jgi:hypothetical protein
MTVLVIAQTDGLDPGLVSAIAVLLGGGLLTAWVAARRAPAQNELDTVQGMKVLLTELREELNRSQEKYDRLEEALVLLEKERDTWKVRALRAEAATS